MFCDEFKQKQQFVTNYFETLFQNKKHLAHAYLLTGNSPLEQYYLALQIARVLNCKDLVLNKDCNCINCSWIKQNKHPAVITVSPIDFLFTREGVKAQPATVIKIDQAQYLKKILMSTSSYHRVIIFTNARQGKEYHHNAQLMWQGYNDKISSPSGIDDEEERCDWIPAPLSRKILNVESANSLLKTIEEPNSNITFFFLSNNKDDMIDTIVSRCQTIQFASYKPNMHIPQRINALLQNFPPSSTAQALYLAEETIKIAKEESLSLSEILDNIQHYLLQVLKANTQNTLISKRIINSISEIEKTKQNLKSYVSPQAALDCLYQSFMHV